jgi:hypothetical protein
MVISLKEKKLDENNLSELLERMKKNKHKRIYLVDINEKDLQSVVDIINKNGYTLNKNLFTDEEYIVELI